VSSLTAATLLTKLCDSITRQWLELVERCSNHLRIFWVWGSLGGASQVGGWPTLPDLKRQSDEPFFCSGCFWKLDYHPSL